MPEQMNDTTETNVAQPLLRPFHWRDFTPGPEILLNWIAQYPNDSAQVARWERSLSWWLEDVPLVDAPVATEPEPPRYASILIWVTAEGRFYHPLIQRRDNPEYCLSQARHYALALSHEGVYKYATVPQSGYRRVQDKLRYRGLRYKSWPTKDGRMIVASDLDFGEYGPGVPTDYFPIENAISLIADWIRDMPDKKRVGGTHKFGGVFSGWRKSHQEPGKYIPVTGSKENVLDSFCDLPGDVADELTPDQRESLAYSLGHSGGDGDFTLRGVSRSQVCRILVANGLVKEKYLEVVDENISQI